MYRNYAAPAAVFPRTLPHAVPLSRVDRRVRNARTHFPEGAWLFVPGEDEVTGTIHHKTLDRFVRVGPSGDAMITVAAHHDDYATLYDAMQPRLTLTFAERLFVRGVDLSDLQDALFLMLGGPDIHDVMIDAALFAANPEPAP